MFGQAWTDYFIVIVIVIVIVATESTLPRSPRAALKRIAHSFFYCAVANLARHQLMNQRAIPGFVPGAESYAPAVEVLARARGHLARYGDTSPDEFDLFTALIGGLIDAQQANQPGGDRWARLLEQGVDMFPDYLDLPGSGRRLP